MKRSIVVLATFAGIVSTACTIGETRYETVKMPVLQSTESITCDSPIAKPSLDQLKTCGGDKGKGHCFDSKKLPMPPEMLPPCDGGNEVCVPDEIFLANGGKLKSCTFVMGNKPGACMSLLVKMVEDYKDMMTQDVCAPDERCAPCTNPLDGTPTHLCDDAIGVHEQDCTVHAGGPMERCCHAMGVCMAEDAAPAQFKDKMKRESCGESQLCAPASAVTGKTTTCSVLGASGVCMDLCFVQVFEPSAPLTRVNCGPTEVCMPCALMSGMPMPGCG
jgi:hypothetical protein